jgi:hypothetical protein
LLTRAATPLSSTTAMSDLLNIALALATSPSPRLRPAWMEPPMASISETPNNDVKYGKSMLTAASASGPTKRLTNMPSTMLAVEIATRPISDGVA